MPLTYSIAYGVLTGILANITVRHAAALCCELLLVCMPQDDFS
jgi:xanthine/uracil/vitamin C permease (AzgA family)